MEKKESEKTLEVSEKHSKGEKEEELMHSFTEKSGVGGSPVKVIGAFIIVAILGIGTGFGLAQIAKSTGTNLIPVASVDPTLTGKTFGSDDTETFKDVAEGTLEEGGIEGEGQFHLVRPGGESQNVYLTSSLIDLSQFVGRKIKVWGQTQSAQHAGWLMDVGRLEVL